MSGPQWTDADQLDDPLWNDYDNYYTNYYGENDPSYTDPVIDPPPGLFGYFPSWRYIAADVDKGVSIEVTTPGGQDCITGIWRRSHGAWFTVVPPAVVPSPTTIHAELTAGETYYILFACVSSTWEFQPVRWYAAILPPAVNLLVPPVAVSVGFDVRVPGEISEIEIPPVTTEIHIGTPRFPALAVPPVWVTATVGEPVPEWPGTFILSAPEDEAEVLTDKPDFTVGILTDDDEAEFTVEVQYDDNPSFSSPVTLSAQAAAVDGGAVLPATTPAPAVTYWRARLLADGHVLAGWTAANTFTVLAVAATTTAIPVTWNFSNTVERPIHMWHFDPPGPDVGDTVTIYGQGFPTTGTLSFGDTPLAITSWQLVPASSDNNAAATRAISGELVTPEHYEVVFTVPEDDGTGAALTLEA